MGENDLISRSALLEAMELLYDKMNRQHVDIYALGRISGFKSAIKIVEDAPAEDIAPVVHAHWTIIDENCCVCSACLNCSTQDYYFCPECGAKMDGENECSDG